MSQIHSNGKHYVRFSGEEIPEENKCPSKCGCGGLKAFTNFSFFYLSFTLSLFFCRSRISLWRFLPDQNSNWEFMMSNRAFWVFLNVNLSPFLLVESIRYHQKCWMLIQTTNWWFQPNNLLHINVCSHLTDDIIRLSISDNINDAMPNWYHLWLFGLIKFFFIQQIIWNWEKKKNGIIEPKM